MMTIRVDYVHKEPAPKDQCKDHELNCNRWYGILYMVLHSTAKSIPAQAQEEWTTQTHQVTSIGLQGSLEFQDGNAEHGQGGRTGGAHLPLARRYAAAGCDHNRLQGGHEGRLGTGGANGIGHGHREICQGIQ